MTVGIKTDQNQIKTSALIEGRNKTKATLRSDKTNKTIEEVLNNPAKRAEIENNWKKKTFGQPGRVPVPSAFDKEGIYPEATNAKIQEIMNLIQSN